VRTDLVRHDGRAALLVEAGDEAAENAATEGTTSIDCSDNGMFSGMVLLW